MCQLLETIKLENGRLCNIQYHNTRMNAARNELFGDVEYISLEKQIAIPKEFKSGLFRCRVVYSREIEKIEFIPVLARQFNKLKLVTDNRIDYHLKFADRTALNNLMTIREDADEIIIVKNGLITDCSIGNLVFYDGQNWLTPAAPLLKGTQRQYLLDTNQIIEKQISIMDIKSFEKVGIINAFFDLKNLPIVNRSNIF